MKKINCYVAAFCMLAGMANAALITQSFDTGQITPGSGAGTLSQFTVNQFDTSLGTLTRVTFSISLDSWGGYYTVGCAEKVGRLAAKPQAAPFHFLFPALTGGGAVRTR